MNATKIGLAVSGVLLAGAGIIIFSQHQAQMALWQQNESLRQQLAQAASETDNLSNRLARAGVAPGKSAGGPAAREDTPETSKEGASTNLIWALMHGGDVPVLTGEQVKRYLEENHRSATSLLSAYRTSHDPALLKEAMEKYPGNPEVAFEGVFKKDVSPTEKREWLENLKKAAPENALPAYLSALDYFKSGQTEQAVQELTAATSRSQFSDYTAERIQNYEEAYRAAGYSDGDAKMAANWGVALPDLHEMKPLAQEVVALAASYRQAGDETSAQAALETAMKLGKQLDAPPGTSVPLITQLVGIAVQKIVLAAMDPSSPYGEGTVQQQLDQLAQRRSSIRDMVNQSDPFRDQMTPEDWLSYNERTRSFGEENAITWLLSKYGARTP